MKKIILIAIVAILCNLLPAQDQEQTQPVPTPQAQAQDMNLKRMNFPQAFIHAGKEYPAGDYWMVLTSKDGQSLFTVSNAKQELLFEELAVVKARSGGGAGPAFRVKKEFLKGKEYFRIKVTTPAQWLMGFFLVKK